MGIGRNDKTLEHDVSHNQRNRTLQQATTSLSPADVLAAARTFFERRSGIYSAFVEHEGPMHVTLRGQGGEEIAHRADVGNRRDVREFVTAVGEKRRRHELEHRVLCPRHGDLTRQRTAPTGDDALAGGREI